MRIGIASLGMYDHGEQQVANDRIWAEIARILRARGIAGVPDRLERTRPVQDHWHDPNLLFGQICGFPLVTDRSLALRVLGRPDYTAPGCADGLHHSLVLTRAAEKFPLEDYRGRRAAINGRDSNTGMNLFRALIADLAGGQPFFTTVHETGSHRQSMGAILNDEADIAAIDAVTYAAVIRAEPEVAASLRIVATTAVSPMPAFVTSRHTPVETVAALRIALAEVAAAPGLADARDALFLRGILPAGADLYAPLLAIERDAAVAGYPELR